MSDAGFHRLRDAVVDSEDVRDASLYWSEARRCNLGIKDGQIGNAHAPLGLAESGGARYLIVWQDGKVSRGYLERRQVLGQPAEALAHARLSAYDDPDAASVLGPGRPVPDVRLHDSAAAAMAGGDTRPVIPRIDAVRERISRHGLRTWSGSFSSSEAAARLWTSQGLDLSGRGTSTGWYVSFNGEIGGGFSARAAESESEFTRRLDALSELARRLDDPGEALPGGVQPVLLHPKVVESYVLGTLFHHLDGSTVHHGEGQFRREQFGSDQPVMREDVFLRVDPLQPLRSGSYRFSSEGVPAAQHTYVAGGRLVSPLLDVKYARRLELEPTPLPYAMDAVEFGGRAALSWDEALQQAGDGLLVLSVLGVHTQDSTSGDFSLSAPQALRIQRGSLAGRLRATISGNLFSLLDDDSVAFVQVEGETTPGLLVPCRADPA